MAGTPRETEAPSTSGLSAAEASVSSETDPLGKSKEQNRGDAAALARVPPESRETPCGSVIVQIRLCSRRCNHLNQSPQRESRSRAVAAATFYRAVQEPQQQHSDTCAPYSHHQQFSLFFSRA